MTYHCNRPSKSPLVHFKFKFNSHVGWYWNRNCGGRGREKAGMHKLNILKALQTLKNPSELLPNSTEENRPVSSITQKSETVDIALPKMLKLNIRQRSKPYKRYWRKFLCYYRDRMNYRPVRQGQLFTSCNRLSQTVAWPVNKLPNSTISSPKGILNSLKTIMATEAFYDIDEFTAHILDTLGLPDRPRCLSGWLIHITCFEWMKQLYVWRKFLRFVSGKFLVMLRKMVSYNVHCSRHEAFLTFS